MLRVMDGHVEADDPAVAEADDDGGLDPQLAHQLDRVLGHVVAAEWTIHDIGSAPVSHLLHRDHTKLGREEWDPLRRDRTRPPVKQQQWRTVSVDFVVHVQPVDGGVRHVAPSEG